MAEAWSRKRPHSPYPDDEDRTPETATIAVNWVIPSFKELLTCRSELLQHELLPGISWQFFFQADALSPQHVRVWLMCAMDTNKSNASACTASYSIQLESSDGTEPPIKCGLQMCLFRKVLCCRNLRMAELCRVEQLCTEGGSLFLSGEITVKLPSGNLSLRRMYASGKFSDLSIKVEDETVKVHKAVLSAACPAILELLRSQKAASVTLRSTPEAVNAMLQYLYDDPLDFNQPDLEDLSCNVLVLAENFKLIPLKRLCETALAEQLKSVNVFNMLGFATKANSQKLKNNAVVFAIKNVDSLVLDNQWTSLKAEFPTTAISLCECVIKSLAAQRETIGQAEGSAVSNEVVKSVSSSVPLEIPVRWDITDFQNLMENSKYGFSITCKEKFSHESMPGITLELIMYPNGKEAYSHHVALFMRPILASNKKSQATAPSGGYSLRFEPTHNNDSTVASAPPPEQILPVQQFSLKSELGIAQFAHQPLVDKHCFTFTKDKSVTLVGRILVEPPLNRQTLLSRKSFESGSHSDFTIKVDEESFPVHKLILSESSPAMQAMFATKCWESENNVLVMKETTVEAVRALLQFWYGDPLCFDGLDELAMDVYKLANRYQELELRQMCETALLRMASPENAVYLAAFAVEQSNDTLEKATAKILMENAEILEQEAWTMLKEDNVDLALTIAERIIAKHRKALAENV